MSWLPRPHPQCTHGGREERRRKVKPGLVPGGQKIRSGLIVRHSFHHPGDICRCGSSNVAQLVGSTILTRSQAAVGLATPAAPF